MPANPYKRPCQVPGCRAWAIRDLDPPLCSPHAGRTRPGSGAPRGNRNHLIHGFYSAARLRAPGLDAQIALTRFTLRRILAMLQAGTTLGAVPVPLTPGACSHLYSLAFRTSRTIGRLLVLRRAGPPTW